MTETPPDWVLIEAAKRSEYKSADNIHFLRQKYQTLRPSFKELCLCIEQNKVQAAEIEALKTMIFATGEAAATNLRTAMERALEIERLREAGQKLNDYACHDDDCQIVTHGVWSDPIPCTCGYEDAWKAWAELGDTK